MIRALIRHFHRSYLRSKYQTVYKGVGGLFSCSDIFDFELSFLG